MKRILQFLFAFLLFLPAGACQSSAAPPASQPSRLKVIATTTIVGDVVAQVAGNAIDLDVLLPVGSDPHSFQPTPQDVAKVADAQVIFANGAGLETFLEPLLKNSGSKARQVLVSSGITLLDASEDDGHTNEKGASQLDDHTGDPHVWMDPNNVLVWVDQIEQTLVDIDGANADLYRQNAAQYRQKLRELDQWILQQIAQIPPEGRELVTDHKVFSYFAVRYGFEQIGAIIPGFSTLAEPSAKELVALEDTIRQLGVGAVFVGDTVNPNLAQRVAQDTGVKLVQLYTGSLTDASGPAGNYLDYIRFNVSAIVSALK